VETIPCDPALDASPQTPEAVAVTIPASTSGTVNVTNPVMPPDVCAFGVHLIGSAAAGTVYADSYVQVRENPLTRRTVTNPTTIALLNLDFAPCPA
jgi:hypothetical protein